MKKALFILPLVLLFLSGCATYTLKKGDTAPYNKGYVVTRYGRFIPEYTIGQDNSLPTDEKLARERFQRRRVEVETYYKKMGYIENRFKQNFIDPPFFIIQTALGIFRLPFIAMNDYKYNHDPQYKESVDKKEDAEYKAEREHLKSLKNQLNAYIQEDLKKEPAPLMQAQALAKEEPVAEKPKQVVEETAAPKAPEVIPAAVETPPLESAPVVSAAKTEEKLTSVTTTIRPQLPQGQVRMPTAVIIAKPIKGKSPLLVQFNAAKSSSPNGRIVSYEWDFGDGDRSTKKNPINTYWSTTYGARKFTATLTVKDVKGISAQASTEIEVVTK